MIFRPFTVACALMVIAVPLHAWNGYDHESGTDIEIVQGNLVRAGSEIEFYDYTAGEYRSADVESVTRYGTTVEIDVYEHQSGEYRTLEMSD